MAKHYAVTPSRLPLEPIGIGEPPAVAADHEPARSAALLADPDGLGERAALVESEPITLDGIVKSTKLPKLLPTVSPWLT